MAYIETLPTTIPSPDAKPQELGDTNLTFSQTPQEVVTLVASGKSTQDLAELRDAMGSFATADTTEEVQEGLAQASPSAEMGERYKDGSSAAKEKLISLAEAVQLIESRGYAKVAPRLKEQVDDQTRTTTFRTDRSGFEVREMTEHQGLVELKEFLEAVVNEQGDKNWTKERMIAVGMLENLTFIGSKEYAEAAAGLGAYWRAYLDGDPERQICVPTRISKLKGVRKSDVFLLENIMSGFSDEEREKYAGRIVNQIDDITAEPDKAKVILLDDWAISGEQMRDSYTLIVHSSEFQKYARCTEINLITSSRGRIENSLEVKPWESSPSTLPIRIPVKAYYLAHDAAGTSQKEHQAHVSGIYSSVDYDFKELIRGMVAYAGQNLASSENGERISTWPALARIIRPYTYSERPVVVDLDDEIY